MQELFLRIQNDSTLMLIAGMALVVLLIIVLVVVVSSMRVKTYKDRFLDVQENNRENAELIASLEKELQIYKIKNASNEQELQQFTETKEILNTTKESLSISQKAFNELEKEQSQLEAKFENLEAMHENLVAEHKSLQERTEILVEDNSKHRVNNARLLMKLETEARFASQMNHKSPKKKNGEEDE